MMIANIVSVVNATEIYIENAENEMVKMANSVIQLPLRQHGY